MPEVEEVEYEIDPMTRNDIVTLLVPVVERSLRYSDYIRMVHILLGLK